MYFNNGRFTLSESSVNNEELRCTHTNHPMRRLLYTLHINNAIALA